MGRKGFIAVQALEFCKTRSPWKRNRIPDVIDAGRELHKPLEAQTESSMRNCNSQKSAKESM